MGLLNDATARIKYLEEKNRDLLQELLRKDNIINELKKLILNDINFPELCDRDKIEDKFKELEDV